MSEHSDWFNAVNGATPLDSRASAAATIAALVRDLATATQALEEARGLLVGWLDDEDDAAQLTADTRAFLSRSPAKTGGTE